MNLSRLLRRKKYRHHRRHIDRKIDLFADGEAMIPKVSEDAEPIATEHRASVEALIEPSRTEPMTVRDAFEAFKKAHENM